MRAIVWSVVLAGCATIESGVDDDDTVADLGVCEGASEEIVLITSMRFARATEGRSDGFDLDGEVSTQGSFSGCGVADQQHFDGTEGIDNSFSNLVPVLEQTEAGALEPLMQYAINEGGMLVLLRWSGIDDPVDDSCVTVETFEGAGDVFLGTQDRLLAGQTLDVDPEGSRSEAPGGRIDGGVVQAGPLEVTVSVEVLDAAVTLTLREVRMRLEPTEDGNYVGVIGGGIDLVDVMAIAEIPGVADYVAELLAGVLGPMADLAPDENGTCTRLSFAAEVEAVPVFLFEDPLPTP